MKYLIQLFLAMNKRFRGSLSAEQRPTGQNILIYCLTSMLRENAYFIVVLCPLWCMIYNKMQKSTALATVRTYKCMVPLIFLYLVQWKWFCRFMKYKYQLIYGVNQKIYVCVYSTRGNDLIKKLQWSPAINRPMHSRLDLCYTDWFVLVCQYNTSKL